MAALPLYLSLTTHTHTGNENLRYKLMHMKDVLERWKIAGLNRKLQIKPKKFEEYTDEHGQTKQRCTSLQLILKWVRSSTIVGFAKQTHIIS